MARFQIGDDVIRSDTDQSATVVEVVDGASSDETIYHITYAEGGDGWWPETALFLSLSERALLG